MYENRFIKNTACPKCREQGKDKHGDNMAVYSDGSSHCWSCGYFDLGNSVVTRFLDKGSGTVPDPYTGINLPEDSDTNYPQQALDWLYQYDLNKQDIYNNGILWSDKECRLLFPYWDNGVLLGWQGRFFGTDTTKKKWHSRGKLENVAHVLFNGRGFIPDNGIAPAISERVGHAMNDATRLVITEDVVSAIKVSKCGIHTMPIFGTNIKSRWSQIRILNYQEVILWLDPDMYTKMIKESRVGVLNGIKTSCVLSKHDPKEQNYEEIRNYISNLG